MKSRASAVWQGDLMSGSGETTLASGAAPTLPINWRARTESQGSTTNPEELIAAAHASCFCMALSHGLAGAGTPAQRLEAEAECTFGQTESGFRIQSIALTVRGQVEGLDEEGFIKAAEAAKDGCPVSQALKGNVEITLDAKLA